ncbi:hypothetical protein MRX96_022745 [Rhipicephalus microplus]
MENRERSPRKVRSRTGESCVNTYALWERRLQGIRVRQAAVATLKSFAVEQFPGRFTDSFNWSCQKCTIKPYKLSVATAVPGCPRCVRRALLRLFNHDMRQLRYTKALTR